MEMLGVAFGIALVAGGIWWVARRVNAQRDAWSDLAAEHGLEVSYPDGGYIKVTGSIGRTAFTYERGKHWSDILVPIPREEMGDLHVAREHVLAKLAKKFGGQDITFDDPVFDDRWRVTCSQPAIARNILKRSVRVALHNTQTDFGSMAFLEVWEGQLRWTNQVGVSPLALPGIVRALGKCARKFAPKKPKEMPDALEES